MIVIQQTLLCGFLKKAQYVRLHPVLNKLTRTLQTAFLFVVCVITQHAFALTLDLKQAIDYAMENNLLLKTSLLDKNVRVHELRILKQKFAPKFSLNLALSVQNEDYFHEDFNEKKIHSYPSMKMLSPMGTQIEIFSEQNVGSEKGQHSMGNALRVVIEQPLLKGRKKIVNTWSIENATLQNEIESLLLKQMVEQTLYQVILTYHALELALENITLQKRWVTNSARFHENLQTKVSSGRAPKSDLSSSLLQVRQAQGQLMQANFEYNQAMRKFKELIGITEEFSIIPHQKRHLTSYPEESAAMRQAIVDNDIELRILNLNKKRIKKQLEVLKDQQLIDIRLRGDWTTGRYHIYGLNSNDLTWNDSTNFNYPFIHQNGNYSAHLLVNIPLSGRQERYHPVFAAKMELEKIELAACQHQQALLEYINGLLEQRSLKKEQINLSVESVTLAAQNYENAVLKLEAGRTSLFEVMQLREHLQDAELKCNMAKIAYLDLQTQLELNAGLLEKKWLTT